MAPFSYAGSRSLSFSICQTKRSIIPFPLGKKHFEKRAEGATRARAPLSASVSPGAEASPLAPKPGALGPALRPPTQGPHLEPSAPQEARLVHGPLVRAAWPAPGPAPACQAPGPRAIGQAGSADVSWLRPSLGALLEGPRLHWIGQTRPSRPHSTPQPR